MGRIESAGWRGGKSSSWRSFAVCRLKTKVGGSFAAAWSLGDICPYNGRAEGKGFCSDGTGISQRVPEQISDSHEGRVRAGDGGSRAILRIPVFCLNCGRKKQGASALAPGYQWADEFSFLRALAREDWIIPLLQSCLPSCRFSGKKKSPLSGLAAGWPVFHQHFSRVLENHVKNKI